MVFAIALLATIVNYFNIIPLSHLSFLSFLPHKQITTQSAVIHHHCDINQTVEPFVENLSSAQDTITGSYVGIMKSLAYDSDHNPTGITLMKDNAVYTFPIPLQTSSASMHLTPQALSPDIRSGRTIAIAFTCSKLTGNFITLDTKAVR